MRKNDGVHRTYIESINTARQAPAPRRESPFSFECMHLEIFFAIIDK
jgi:hypothetical protein